LSTYGVFAAPRKMRSSSSPVNTGHRDDRLAVRAGERDALADDDLVPSECERLRRILLRRRGTLLIRRRAARQQQDREHPSQG
jgi:hypothetical protein